MEVGTICIPLSACENTCVFYVSIAFQLKNRVSALENENEYLREDLRDYKLLRKVFGSRQIDNLLEQARANKGKRRDERLK